ncbi:hypothetical protein QBC43DRAFT_355451, partial [Cladorrhinum sp. PSN259]
VRSTLLSRITAAILSTVLTLNYILTVWRYISAYKCEVIECSSVGAGTQLRVSSSLPVAFYPGSYYIIYSKVPSVRHKLFLNFRPTLSWYDINQDDNLYTSDFTVHIQSSNSSFKNEDKVRLAGPYGYELSMARFKSVTIVVEGENIFHVLPFALYRVRLKQPVNVIWSLDEGQELFILDYLIDIRMIDEVKCLNFWFYLPISKRNRRSISKITSELQLKEEDYFKFTNRDSLVDVTIALEKVIEQHTVLGECMVIASGKAQFAGSMRNKVIAEIKNGRNISFHEIV